MVDYTFARNDEDTADPSVAVVAVVVVAAAAPSVEHVVAHVEPASEFKIK